MEIQCFVVTPFAENCYVIKVGDEALVIDPGEAAPQLLDSIKDCTVKTVVNTHGHIDHVAGNAGVLAATGAELVCHKDAVEMIENVAQQGGMFGMEIEPSPAPDRLIDEGDTVSVGDVELGVINCPGHAPGHIALVGEGFVIGGDVLFQGSIGRTDLPGGSMDVLMDSIKNKFMTMDDDVVVLSGHGPQTTIGAERATNPFIAMYG